jgi:hypothetical protein
MTRLCSNSAAALPRGGGGEGETGSAILSFFREPKYNTNLAMCYNNSPITSSEARVRGSELTRRRRAVACAIGPRRDALAESTLKTHEADLNQRLDRLMRLNPTDKTGR